MHVRIRDHAPEPPALSDLLLGIVVHPTALLHSQCGAQPVVAFSVMRIAPCGECYATTPSERSHAIEASHFEAESSLRPDQIGTSAVVSLFGEQLAGQMFADK